MAEPKNGKAPTDGKPTDGKQPPTEGDKLLADVTALLRARIPLVVLLTPEEKRVEGAVAAAAATVDMPVKLWDHAQGVHDLQGKEVAPGKQCALPGAVLQAIAAPERAVWILKDFHHFWKSPKENRALRNLAITLPNVQKKAELRSIVLISPPHVEVPPEFQDHVVVVKWKLPDRVEMAGVFDRFLAGLSDAIAAKTATTPEVREAAIDAALGMSVVQAQNAIAKSIVTKKGLVDPVAINEAKKLAVNAGHGIEYHDPDPRGLDAVGGLANLKAWLRKRDGAFTERARAFGIAQPRGVLIVGVSGCGKSATAKAIPTAWGVPLLRLDMGAAKGGIVGESERKIRAAFAVADAIGKCVVWIDEIEKSLAGAVGGALDSGVSSDALGALLTWMEERRGAAFVIATANDVSKLPPEVMRKGRFDAIFFVDLPNREERREILAVALKRVGHAGDPVDVGEVVRVTEGFAGVEVAQLVPDALHRAFSDGERPLRTADVVAEAGEVVPLSRTAPEKIKAIREWAATRARPASVPEAQESTAAGDGSRALDVDMN